MKALFDLMRHSHTDEEIYTLSYFNTTRCSLGLSCYTETLSYNPDCNYFHHEKNSRRNPFVNLYLPKRCKEHLFTRYGTSEDCPFAHTDVEVRYHPLNYRMELCSFGKDCKNVKCAYSHDPVMCQKKNDIKDKLFREYNKLIKFYCCRHTISLSAVPV